MIVPFHKLVSRILYSLLPRNAIFGILTYLFLLSFLLQSRFAQLALDVLLNHERPNLGRNAHLAYEVSELELISIDLGSL